MVICDGADEVVMVEAAVVNFRGKEEEVAETMMAGEVVLWLVQ